MKRIFLILAFLLSWSICLADMPHILKDGDIVDADQLNENFNHLEENHKIYTVKSNGNIIGTTQFNFYQSRPHPSILTNDRYFHFLFNKDFYDVFLYKDGTLESVYNKYFKSNSCQGDPYIFYGNNTAKSFVLVPSKGMIVNYQNSLYYYPKNTITHKFIYQSYKKYYNDACINETGDSNYLYIKLLPNDPAVTGILTYPFPLPITIDGIELIIQD